MKRIIKGPPPTPLIAWIALNRSTPNFNYQALSGETHAAIKDALLLEQGGLCCYTGQRVHADNSHIEHFKPQNRCAPGEDVEYTNLHAAYPHNGGDTTLGYGAPFKAGWYEPYLLVSPLSSNCENRFRFDLSGSIHAANLDDEGARATIEKLGLDCLKLVSLRRAAIESLVGNRTRPPLTKTALERLLIELDRRDGQACFRPFCFVLKQAVQTVLEKARRTAQARAFARRGSD